MQFTATVAPIIGAVVLLASLRSCCSIVRQLPRDQLRWQWTFLAALIVVFVIGYLLYAFMGTTRPGTAASLTEVLLAVILLGGSLFVYVVCRLSLTTIDDIQRISVLEEENIRDPLTGLFNRRYLARRLDEEVARSLRYDVPLTLLMFDIDHFKQVNDKYGHQVGDEVLREVARVLSDMSRETDFVARYGGEELVIVLPHTAGAMGALMAERCRKKVASRPLVELAEDGADVAVSVTVSVGVSDVRGARTDVEALIKHADSALYAAKKNGRNRVVAHQ